MRLSIIIPLYNSGEFLPTCLDSLLRQGLDPNDYEILIINDGSTDNSLDIANAYVEANSSIRVFSKENGGVGSARNKGLSLAKGDYIYFIDPDDYLADRTLPILLDVTESNTLDILTFGSKSVENSVLQTESNLHDNIELSTIYNGIDYIANFRFQNEVWWYLIKHSFIKEAQIRFIEGRWMEDAILTAQLFIQANQMANFPLDSHRHVIVKGSAMKSKEPSHYLRVIDDNRNAAMVFESMITDLEAKHVNPDCIKRLRTRQQSFVFFMMVRMLRSTIALEKIKPTMNELSTTNAYPMTEFVGVDYNGLAYAVLTRLFNHRPIFYSLFRLFNPLLR
ncbi:glycosyltransferase [Winogradskyella sp.]|uniref:glycosyltransferase n=1 Tax=Winogradskyella sp. TaxID=1883156 RepID=UPI00261C1543|nr:glycosyltransferase [Winogradskyella sp.]